MMHVELKGIPHVATRYKIVFLQTPHTPPPLAWMGSNGQNSTFSEHGHVAYQIKWNRECSTLQAHIMCLHTPSAPGVGSKVKTIF